MFEIPLNPSVRSLNLHCNGLSKIEGLLTAWYIRHLDLSSNKISCIEGLESLTSLQTLNLSCNLISKVEGLHGLVSLKRLNLSYNQISFLYLHGNEYKLKHLYLQCNRVNSMSQLLQCMRGLQSLRSVTLNLEGSRNPVCDTPGYREIILQSLPQLSALDGMDRHGNRVHSSDENALDILGLEDFADFLLSDVSVNNEKVLTRFHQRADHAKINQPTNIVEGKASSPNSPKRLLDAGNLLRIKKLENQVSQLIQLAPSSPSSTSTPTLTSMEKAKRDTDLTTESERDSGKEDNRKGASLRSRIPTHHKGLLTSRKQSTRDLRSQRSNRYELDFTIHFSSLKVDPPKKSQHVQTAPPSNTEGKHAAGAKDGKISMHTEEETYRAIIEERDQERERRWKAEQALKKLTEQLQNLQTQASEEKNLQNLALHTTDRLKELLLKERANCVKLQQRVEELERSLHSAQDELVQARSQEQQQQSVLHRLQDTATQNETLWAQQQAEETKRIQELENQVAALRREIEILRALAQQRKDKLHQLHELLASREQSHRKELESWIHPKGPEFHEAVAQAAAVSEQHHSQQLADLQEKLTEARQRYTDLEDEFRMALTIEAARFAEVKEGFNLQAAELTDCKAALAMSRQKEQQSATLVQELTSMVKEQKTRIAELIKSKREAVTDLKARVRTLEATVEDDKHRRLQLELLKQEKFKLLSELATQESVIDGLRAERKIWGQELAQQGASLAQDRGRLEARIEVLSTEVQTLRKQNESDNKTLKIKAKIVEDNTETIRKLKEAGVYRSGMNRLAISERRVYKPSGGSRRSLKKRLYTWVEQLIARKEELKQQLEDKEAELGEVKKEHSVMKRKWKDKAELLTQLEFQVKRMKESFDSKEKLLADEREKAVQAHK
ncbi:leucine-rich repeat and coiled-coil domain-containing protein 1-like [Scleropages formosus]|uniref:Leucine-rich repeat and coiled-coil domain-containing protein 1 n=1 Tax=Scleropages formosus TaxID=113540 RepID=A0A0N8JW14_SCLFO|nr:leucine-rich repeat and coiled-coil domain-containing protein 1-like [Scleropages formosus]